MGKDIFIEEEEGELDEKVVVAKNATTTQHGAMADKFQTHYVRYYNLDVIISLGYRVKSQRGTQFRIWANSVLKYYLNYCREQDRGDGYDGEGDCEPH